METNTTKADLAEVLGELGVRSSLEGFRVLRGLVARLEADLVDAERRVTMAGSARYVQLERQLAEAKRTSKQNRVMSLWRDLAVAFLRGEENDQRICGEQLELQECGEHGWFSLLETPEAKGGCPECREADENANLEDFEP